MTQHASELTEAQLRQKRARSSRRLKQYPIEGLYARYGPHCHWCGKLVPIEEATREHLVKVCDGGKTNWANLRLAHYVCNQAREGCISSTSKPGERNPKKPPKKLITEVKLALTRLVVFPSEDFHMRDVECPYCGHFSLAARLDLKNPIASCDKCSFNVEIGPSWTQDITK